MSYLITPHLGPSSSSSSSSATPPSPESSPLLAPIPSLDKIKTISYPFFHGHAYGTALDLTCYSDHPDVISTSKGTVCWMLAPVPARLEEGSVVKIKDSYPIESINIYRDARGNLQIILKMSLDNKRTNKYYLEMHQYLNKQKMSFYKRGLFSRERLLFLEHDHDARPLLQSIQEQNLFTTKAKEIMEKALVPPLFVTKVMPPERKDSEDELDGFKL